MKLREIKYFLPILLALPFVSSASGGSVGNGGDSIKCESSESFPFTGTFVLDFALEYQPDELAAVHSWEESFHRTLVNLKRLSPSLAFQFEKFEREAFIPYSTGSFRVWKGSNLQDVEIEDEEVLRALPKGCRGEKFQQTVVRTYSRNHIFYNYNEKIIRGYQKSNPLQLSFILIHEWLWDYTSSVRALRKLNWLIHSKRFDSMESDEFHDLLYRYGFFNRSLGPCERSSFVQDLYWDRCDRHPIEQLVLQKRLVLSSKQVERSRPGDFRGLFSIETIVLDGVKNVFGHLAPHSFQDFFRLRKVSLKDCNIKEFPIWLWKDFKFVEVLDLRINPILKVPDGLRTLPNLKKVLFSENEGFDKTSLQGLNRRVKVVFD